MENYSINEAKEAIKVGIRCYLAKDEQGNYLMEEVNRIPFYLEASPGIGKTQSVSQIAEELNIGFVSFSITHHSRNTVLGLPVISEVNGQKYTEYTMSEIIAKVLEKYEAGEKEGILLLDEFNCMSDTIMPVMLSFLQTKNIGTHTLPEGWVIVLCGNPSSYNKSARKFDFAILDRLRRVPIEFSSSDFLEYAEKKSFEKVLLDYLKLNPADIYVCSKEKEENLVTSRAWENLDITMKLMNKLGEELDQKMIAQYIKSDRISKSFYKYYSLHNSASFDNQDYDNILAGKNQDKYIAFLKDANVYTRMDIIDNLFKLIHLKLSNRKLTQEKSVACLDHMIALYRQLDDASCLETVFQKIKSDKKLISILYNHKSEEFLSLAKDYYGESLAM